MALLHWHVIWNGTRRGPDPPHEPQLQTQMSAVTGASNIERMAAAMILWTVSMVLVLRN